MIKSLSQPIDKSIFRTYTERADGDQLSQTLTKPISKVQSALSVSQLPNLKDQEWLHVVIGGYQL